jgi:hypothetical protein
MRLRLALLVAVTSLLTVVSPASAAGPTHVSAPSRAAHTATTDWAFVRHELFDVPLAQFLRDRLRGDRWFDWTHDGCSAPLLGSSGRAYDFLQPCMRHDFGYRNLKRLEHRYGTGRTYWNATNRRRVDQQFLADMKSHCKSRSWLLRVSCFVSAYTYYTAVRSVAGP